MNIMSLDSMWLELRKRVEIRKMSMVKSLKVEYAKVKRGCSGEHGHNYIGKKKDLK